MDKLSYVMAVLIAMLLGFDLGKSAGYEQGQIDYAQGKIKFRPVNKVIWEEVGDGNVNN